MRSRAASLTADRSIPALVSYCGPPRVGGSPRKRAHDEEPKLANCLFRLLSSDLSLRQGVWANLKAQGRTDSASISEPPDATLPYAQAACFTVNAGRGSLRKAGGLRQRSRGGTPWRHASA